MWAHYKISYDTQFQISSRHNFRSNFVLRGGSHSYILITSFSFAVSDGRCRLPTLLIYLNHCHPLLLLFRSLHPLDPSAGPTGVTAASSSLGHRNPHRRACDFALDCFGCRRHGESWTVWDRASPLLERQILEINAFRSLVWMEQVFNAY